MSILEDIMITNKRVIEKSAKAVQKNTGLLIVGAIYLIAVIVVSNIAMAVGFLGGLVMTLFQSAVLSNYLFLMNRIIRVGHFTQDDFRMGFRVYFRKIWVVSLIIWVAEMGISLVVQPLSIILPQASLLSLIIPLIAFIVFNPLPETLYQKHLGEVDSFTYAFSFVKENWIDWFVPNIVLMGACYGIYWGVQKLFETILRNLSYSLKISLSLVLIAILLQAILGYMMVYRGYLFDTLSTTTRRKRLFMRYMNKENK